MDVFKSLLFVKDSRIETADIHSLQLSLSGEVISVSESQRLLSDLVMKRWIDVSVEALDSLLLSQFVTVESEDELLRPIGIF
jgi:hypothetical protein